MLKGPGTRVEDPVRRLKPSEGSCLPKSRGSSMRTMLSSILIQGELWLGVQY